MTRGDKRTDQAGKPKETPPKEPPPKESKLNQTILTFEARLPSPRDSHKYASTVTSPKPTKGFEQSQSVPSGTVPDPQDLERNIQLASTGLPSTLDEGTRKSQPLPEGTDKTTSRPKGSLGDKDSGGNKPPANMELIHPTVADLLGTGDKYKLQTFVDVQAFLLSEDELDKESDEEKVLAFGEYMDEDPQYLKKMSRVLFSRITETQWEQHEEGAVSYADLKASIEEYYDENVAHRDQSDKMVESTMNTIDKRSTVIKDIYQGLNVLTQLLKDINNVVKDDPATNKKLDEAIETFANISTNTTKVLFLVKDFDFFTFQSTVKDLQAHALKQEGVSVSWTKTSTKMAWNLGLRMTAIEISQSALKHEVFFLRQDTSKINSMMTEIYQAFKGQPSLAPSRSVTSTLALTNILANLEMENATNTATEKPPSHTEGETEDPKWQFKYHQSNLLKIDKGKGIATESDEDPSKKLVPTSIVHPDPYKEVKVPYMINGNMCYLTNTEMQAYLDKEKKLRKAVEEARLLDISKPKVNKVVQEEAEKIGLDPNKITSDKAEVNKKRAEQYMWTMTNTIKHEPITDVKIHPNIKPVVLSVYRNNDKRNFDVHQPFKFIDFRITELDKLGAIIQKKKNFIVKYLMTSKRYERLKKFPVKLGIQSVVPEQASSQTSERKMKHMELEPEVKVLGLECNRIFLEDVPFANSMVIKEPEYGIFFTDVFGDQAFQRWNDIHKVGVDSLVSYLVMVSMVKIEENARFSL
nr:hypothetical protein [Tanacetum cinerariifolium]